MTEERRASATDVAPIQDNSPDDLDECQLAQRIARDDRVAFALLYDAYFPRLGRLFAHLMTSTDPQLSEQLIEETMLSAWVARESLTTVTSVYQWIMGLAFMCAHRFQQLQGRSTPAPNTRPACQAYTLLEPLPLDERAVAYLCYTGHSCQHIAEIMNESTARVNILLHRAATCMRGRLLDTVPRNRHRPGLWCQRHHPSAGLQHVNPE